MFEVDVSVYDTENLKVTQKKKRATYDNIIPMKQKLCGN